MQRTRYRRTAIKTKKKMAEIEKKSQNKARKIERFELVYSSPHIAKNPAASTSADTKASASASGDDDVTAPVELVTTKDISPTSARSEPQEIPPAATTCEVEDSAHGTGVSTQRSPAAIWSRGTAVLGLTTFDGVCSCVNTHRTPKSRGVATPVRHRPSAAILCAVATNWFLCGDLSRHYKSIKRARRA
ncbi:hypothetical protein JG687_00013700 [Phytophthora cactorum]|uniref:Uncharacterized protein n=1 Tax=Phytophthora cactorum TaxID=29920 RepID=A0A8T1U170_9STRA|nr:hypothetical protein JG687_00013700 [Phytophthora cactorum]